MEKDRQKRKKGMRMKKKKKKIQLRTILNDACVCVGMGSRSHAKFSKISKLYVPVQKGGT